jgi:hypothetical protein
MFTCLWRTLHTHDLEIRGYGVFSYQQERSALSKIRFVYWDLNFS